MIRLATIRESRQTHAVRLEADHAVKLPFADVGRLLDTDDWETTLSADGPQVPLDALDYAPIIPHPEKILCAGQNFRSHVQEMGRELPEYPTLFAKFARSLIGALDDVIVPASSEKLDFEAEVAVVLGRKLRNGSASEAVRSIAGFTIMNDVSVRDWQYRTTQWLQGKTFEQTTPLGPHLVIGEPELFSNLSITCEVNGEEMQAGSTADLIFAAADIVEYVSEIITLVPGDVIALGTPGGVGQARQPPRYLQRGDVLVTRVEHLGECRNTCQPSSR
jgi:acylpyruvate hydrolase